MSAQITWLEEVESTNDELRKRIDTLDNLSVIAARRQTAGRGQGDHKWHSRPGENLTFTVHLKFGGEGGMEPLEAIDSLIITETVTLALRLYLEDKGILSRIKWPNDIYVGDRKICGILIENILSGSCVTSSIVGIGLNLNQTEFPVDLPNPISIAQITGKQYDAQLELEIFCNFLAECVEKTDTADGRRYLDEIFNKYMFRLDGSQLSSQRDLQP